MADGLAIELNMGQTHLYPTSAQLDAVVLRMYRAGVPFAEAVREFRKRFILTVLRDFNWNESKAAPVLGMHRNTLRRTLQQLDLDIHILRKAEYRRVHIVRSGSQKKLAG